jgi:hypothetical protein
VHEKLFVVAKAVQFIKDGIALGLVGIEGSRKHDAVRNAAGQDFAGDGVALDAAESEGRRDANKTKEAEESGER